MEAKTKTGRIVHGKLAELLVKHGSAIELTSKLTAKEIAEIIAKEETVDELNQYKDDKRQIVFNAYKKKIKELK